MLTLSFLLSCDGSIESQFNGLPQEVVEIISRFDLEAKKRGVNIDLFNVSFEFKALEDDKIGSCQIRGKELTVILDTNSVFWRVSGPLGHEELIFHELGHCVLGRDHLNDLLK